MDLLQILALIIACVVMVACFGAGVRMLGDGATGPGVALVVLSPVAGIVTFFLVAFFIIVAIAVLIFIALAGALSE